MSALEARYRRLLAIYPPAHRDRYLHEMLGTLMEGAAEGQRSPRPRETLDLLWNALWLRVRREGAPRARDLRWADATAIFGTFGALALAVIYGMVELGNLAWRMRMPSMPFASYSLSSSGAALAVGWLVVALVALAGWRRLAAIVAWAIALPVLAMHLDDPAPLLVEQWTRIVLGITVAACLTRSPGGRSVWQTFGRAKTLIIGGAALACTVSLWVDVWMARVELHADGDGARIGHFGINLPFAGIDTIGAVPALLFLATFGLLIWLLVRAGGGIRRRLLALLAVPIVAYFMVEFYYAGLGQASMEYLHMPILSINQEIALFAVPLLTFGIGVLVVRRKDRQEHLMASAAPN